MAPTPEGLPDPHAQQALLHPMSSQHSPSERRARNAHAKALGVAAKSAPTPASSSSASRGQVASQLNFTALIECCCGETSAIAAESIKAGLKTIRLTADSNPIGTDAGDAASHKIVKELAAENHKIHLWGSLPCTMWSQYTELNLRKLGPRFRAKVAKARKPSRVLLQSFIKLAKAVTKVGGTWSFEWPKLATGWKLPELHDFFWP